jgi:predicted Rossmann-fold nucleotide-binding protein
MSIGGKLGPIGDHDLLGRLGRAAYQGADPVLVDDLAARKKMMFDDVDGVLCYPGGIGTWDELFDLLARRSIDAEVDGKPACPPIFLYIWENYYAPLLLQLEIANEMGLIHERSIEMIRPFESAEALAAVLR